MSIFSRLAKNLKRGLRKIAPIIAPFIPGVGGVLAGLITPQIRVQARTPGIVPDIARPPLPGAGRVAPRTARFPRGRGNVPVGRRVITPGPVRQQMSIFGAVPVIARTAPALVRAGAQAVGRFIGSPVGRATIGVTAATELARTFAGGAGGVCPAGEHLNKQDGVGGPAGTYCVKNRRMNFGNARAARRGVRRLKGARKLLKDIEKMMPRAPARRRAPDHHHHPRGGVV